MSAFATSWLGTRTKEIDDPFELLEEVSKANKGIASAKAWLKNQKSKVSLFSVVTIKYQPSEIAFKFMLVPHGFRDVISFEEQLISAGAPVGASAKGAYVGSIRSFITPSGRTQTYEISEIETLTEERLLKLCQETQELMGLVRSSQNYIVDYRYNVYPSNSAPRYIHGTGPARHRMGG
jgi:transcription elongation GreA/GreB family factor